jgi:hypothetical protein
MRAPRCGPPVLAAAALAALLAGCSTAGPAPADATTAGETGTLPSAPAHGVALDPGDGAAVGHHEGLVEVNDDGELDARGPVIDLMGFTVTGPDYDRASDPRVRGCPRRPTSSGHLAVRPVR